MTRWRPIHPSKTIVSAVFAGIPGLLLIVLLFSVVTGSGTGATRDLVIACGLVALFTLGAWRMTRTGIYLSDRGVRIQHLADSDVVEWADVLRVVVRTRQSGWSFFTTQIEEIWLVVRDGDPVGTAVMRAPDRPWDGRPRWGVNFAITSDPAFYQTLTTLEDGLARSREAVNGSS
ncbi:hypothetical protein [Actinophytocola sp. NPDC049390]|uniref:hypothetical protein n=1 Tax=Actinophytocola sp. NPDC049390 TaxID=3363894 RepID=UPI0037A74B80